MSDPTPTVEANASPTDSILLTLARAAIASRGGCADVTWPHLDLTDPAQRAFGDYELLEEIGRGGMGVVYRARQHSLDRDVAIKFIAAGLADVDSVGRFLAEARAAARLVHPNIVPVYEVGSIDGVHYFSMPLVRGHSLAQQLERGVLSTSDVVDLMLHLCDAVDYAHRLGLLHLDLKPANVLVDERGEPLIADFGLARHMDARGGVDAQEVSGTPAFMAPEQVLIRQFRLTAATDIYAMGALLYRAITGRSPHGEGSPDDVIRRATAGRIPRPRTLTPSVPADLDAVCMKCLELQPGDRYLRAADLADDLRRVRDGLPVSVRRPGAFERVQRWCRREPRLALATLAAFASLLIGAVATSWQWRVAAQQRDVARASEAMAKLERDRARRSSALGAWLYSQSYQSQQDNELAPRMLEWLRARPGLSTQEQATALTRFVSDLNTQAPAATESIIWPMIGVMGGENRRAVIDHLLASPRPDRYALAARLAWYDDSQAAQPRMFGKLLDAAIAAQPADIGVWTMAATFCTPGKAGRLCRHPEAASRLRQLQPDNAFPWILQAMADPGAINADDLHEASTRTQFDDNFRLLFGGYRDAIVASGVQPPPLIADPLKIIAPGQPSQLLVVEAESAPFPITGWQPLLNHCDPGKRRIPASERADCLAIGLLMSRSRATLVTRYVGGIMVRRLSTDRHLAQEMWDSRRRWSFVRDSTFRRLTPQQRINYPVARLLDDVVRDGEMEAWSNRLAYYGLPTVPEADWRPANPNELLLPEQRQAAAKSTR